MPTFKVTVHIYDGLTLGHVLMTKGVDLLHIVQEDDIIEHHTSKKYDTVKLLASIAAPQKKQQIQREHFRHPTGKPIKEFVVEYLTQAPMHTARWKDMNNYVRSLGFGRSSLNNSLKFLTDGKLIKREKNGYYRLIDKK